MRMACAVLIAALITAIPCGCSYLKPTKAADTAEVKTLQPKSEKPRPTTLTVLQSEVMRFADDYASTVAQAADDFSSSTTNEACRVTALKWKLEQAGAAYVNAAGRNPALNALDMVVLATLARMVVEDPASTGRFGEPVRALAETHRRLETNAWRLVESVLRPEQKAELSDLMREWRERNPNQRYVGGVRFREFAAELGKTPQAAKSKPTSVFNLLFIDPMAGLDPAARAIEETRQSAERITYYAQRAPILLSWQIELLSYQLADQPAARQFLADANRFSKSSEVLAQTADRIPGLVDQQREAAIKQLLDGLASERTNLVAALATQEANARTLLTDTRDTLNAGSQMASSVQGAVESLHSFVRFVSPSLGSNAAPVTVSTNKRPFNILDYGTAAGQVGAMAVDMNSLLTGVNQTAPHLSRLTQDAKVEAQNLMTRAFGLAVLLILILLASGIVYRFVSLKLAQRFESNQQSTRGKKMAASDGGIGI